MCRMMGISGGTSSFKRRCLEAFYPLCRQGKVKSTASPGHLDGWGISGYPNGQAFFYGRQPTDASRDTESWKTSLDLVEAKASPTLLAHFRKASIGDRALNNTHPFEKNGWFFCHNGTFFDAPELPLKKYKPLGRTDSEHFFLFLLEILEGAGGDLTVFEENLRETRDRYDYNSLTFLLTNGQALIAYRDYSEKRLDKGETVSERDGYYTLWKTSNAGASIVSSEPLPALNQTLHWVPLKNQEIITLTLP